MKDTRDYILKKSLELFLQKSYKEVTMREIVNKTGLSKGAFYHYFESKEAVFEEVVKYFYNHEIITDYTGFPQTSLKDFYMTYLHRLQNPGEAAIEPNDNTNLFAFVSEAARKIPSFLEIHANQRKKEVSAWTEAIKRAKQNGEINTSLSTKIIAQMFLNLSDGIALNRTIAQKPDAATLDEIRTNWDSFYKLLR